jgi:flagellum-specific peptidoglycan hydrolase FlgJ
MKNIILVIVMLLLFLNLKAENYNPTTYIDKYDEMSISLMKKTCIPASIILAISMLESGCGTSKISKFKHNFFGVKKENLYRSYENDTASFNDFCILISKKKFYNILTKNNNSDYNIWLTRIKNIGYSEDPNWSRKVLLYIKKYKLYELDCF